VDGALSYAPSIDVTVTEGAGHASAFVYGALELYVNYDHAGAVPAFSSGALTTVVVDSASPFESAGAASALVNGTLADTTVLAGGTEFMGMNLNLPSGTLADVVVHAGTWPEPTGLNLGFLGGDCATIIVDLGTKFEFTGLSVGFRDGALV
jgi:hypothetical protein